MFSTTKQGEIPGYSLMTGGNEFGWNFVQCKIFEPWFHIECRILDDTEDEYYSKVFFIRYVDDVMSIANETLMTITDISLISPPRMNNQGCWKMDKLKEIWVGYEPNIEGIQESTIFVLENNKRYIQSALSTSEKKLLRKQKIFSI